MFEIENEIHTDVLVTSNINNDQIRFKTHRMKRDFLFDKISVGAGMEILYDLIIHKWILKQEEIDKIVLFLNKVHKITE